MNSAIKVGQRFSQSPQFSQNKASIAVSCRKIRIDLDGPIEAGKSFLKAIHVPENHAFVGMNFFKIRLCLDNGVVECQGTQEIALAMSLLRRLKLGEDDLVSAHQRLPTISSMYDQALRGL